MSSDRDTRTRILDAAVATLDESPHVVNVKRVAQLSFVSRQAIYLHFRSRAELLVATARHVDDRLDLERHLQPLRRARSAEELLKRNAEFLATYNPLLCAVIRAADAMRRSDPEVATAWNDRLAHRRQGAYEIARRLAEWRRLGPGWTRRSAGDWLTAQASVKVWEELVMDLGYSRRRYVALMTRAATAALLAGRSES